ncbi:MAG: hypothetical protein AB7F50_06415 [Fimbriimonadaceae bacterium]
MTALPLLLLALAPAKVTFEHEAAPVGKVLAALSEKTGLELSVGPTPMREIVFVKVSDADVVELKAKIAEATSCKWAESEGKSLLVPDANRRRLEEQFDESEFRTRLGLTLNRFKEQLANRSNEDRREETLGVNRANELLGRGDDSLALRCAVGIGLNGLSVVRRDGRVVWSTSPTSGQLALRIPGLEAEVAKAVKDHNAAVDAPIPSGDDATESEMIRQMMEAMGPLLRPARAEGTPALVHVIGSRAVTAYDSGLRLEIVVYNEKGQRMVSSESSLASEWEQEMAEEPPTEESAVEEAAAEGQEVPPPPVEETPAPEPQWEFSKETQDWLRLVENGGWNRTKDEDARKLILAIVERDPLAYGPSEALSHYADKTDRDIVACLPDNAKNVLSEARNVSTVEASWAKGGSMKMIQAGTWLVLSPKSPSVAREGQFDRAALARLLASGGESGIAPLDRWAEYAVDNPDPNENAIAGSLARLMLVSDRGLFSSDDRWLLLRLFGTLAPVQRSAPNGTAVPVGVWSQIQRAAAGKWVYGPDPNLSPKLEQSFLDMLAAEIPFGGQSSKSPLNLEPTQVAPGGIHGNTALVLTRTTDVCYSPAAREDSGFPDSVGIEELALLELILSDEKTRQGIEEGQPLPRLFKVGKRQKIRLSIEVAPGVFASGELYDDSFDANAESVGLTALPEDQRARIESLADQMRKSPIWTFLKMMGSMGGFGGREEIPPRH